MQRAYYSDSIEKFLQTDSVKIYGELSSNHENKTLDELQKNAWKAQIEILKEQLKTIEGKIYFEFAIPRMGKRVDNILIIKNIAFVVEFKIGSNKYDKNALEQVIDYSIDLKNFHEGSHNLTLIPLLIATEAEIVEEDLHSVKKLQMAAKANKHNISSIIKSFLTLGSATIDHVYWENSIYKPTPTIVEAAQALYKGHNVKEITRSDSGAINLSRTSSYINSIIEFSKQNSKKSICFITGVPGAGKTLAGLNIAVDRMKTDEDEHAVFLSGNGPLVEVLREALTRDEVKTAKAKNLKITKKQAAIKANAFIQNIHHFRDDNLKSSRAPIEKVVVFDEAQRAWTLDQTSSFMKRKKGKDDFNMSEPEFLIDVMDRHIDWCVIICLIGGGQEINTGEAGLEEWVVSLSRSFPDWSVHYSTSIISDKNYLRSAKSKLFLENNGTSNKDLHLAVSVRSFRSELLSKFIQELLDLNLKNAKLLYEKIHELYPIVLTRNLEIAKSWLKDQSKGTERIGIIASSGARRLRPLGIDVKNEISASNWFLNNKEDIRSSYFLEDVATEFDIQGLEIDWSCVAWGANFYVENMQWRHQKLKGTKWQNINLEIHHEYLKNTYRVLLTRARQGMVIYLPKGDAEDHTRLHSYYDETYQYLKNVGLVEI
ncbi:Uncharacterized conserved protein [Nonlabens sp. Hel1_33_55]|uniref:DUF2075 domain-containing protein n=1 Tax=Nonlabens sp. Hel1_33_55 TaxID=1336802 RepID=UPI000875AC76|nr:DUF2075 domain-containing protein [Nonlabens sp. Hel1_33_55]SCY32586.1 Uncharacterized conserved protein [Nonlabens sp. Hel1_33_55]